MIGYLKHLLHRNEVKRQYGFFSDYRVCVIDLLKRSLTDQSQNKTGLFEINSSQIDGRLSKVIQKDWHKGVNAHTCRDELLHEMHQISQSSHKNAA
ncbi:hypothetical protein MIB92_02065 [Aestuariirhabdus sp. Z084]|uniref:hypothetical protein n=1 Tax=Aestuariirhabdus haliotis TaxID=2918751 RepID=UPI00201B427B|nr:hypothetical protein [Aestuariirhabdus haliotis]MCL6414425.1 hypothetical protein [Aestuariirhabdus haliotis]MCL6418593.1 hypothetical protein [Aestuariirhabdus haliotis]